MYRSITLHIILFCLMGLGARAQGRWIANGSFADTPSVSLYDLCNKGKPLVLAVGNIHTPASARLLESDLLQKLDRDQGGGSRYATGELQVAFLNVRVFPDEPRLRAHQGITVFNVEESDDVLSRKGWAELYSIHGTGLFLITPDRLVHKLEAGTAAEVYELARNSCSRLKPLRDPDARLIHAGIEGGEARVSVEVQNFSREPMRKMQIIVSRAQTVLARIPYDGIIPPMEAAIIHVPLAEVPGQDHLEITAVTEGDCNPFNNTWTGRLIPDSEQPVAAASLTR